MPACEMCGYTGNLHKAIVEGTLLLLCDKCVRFGEVVALQAPSPELVERRLAYYRTRRYAPLSALPSEEETIVKDYALRVKGARERLGKTQEEIALALAEKLSVLQKVESGHMEPPLKLARKLEQYFKIELLHKIEGVDTASLKGFSSSGSAFTIGDVIKHKD